MKYFYRFSKHQILKNMLFILLRWLKCSRFWKIFIPSFCDFLRNDEIFRIKDPYSCMAKVGRLHHLVKSPRALKMYLMHIASNWNLDICGAQMQKNINWKKISWIFYIKAKKKFIWEIPYHFPEHFKVLCIDRRR